MKTQDPVMWARLTWANNYRRAYECANLPRLANHALDLVSAGRDLGETISALSMEIFDASCDLTGSLFTRMEAPRTATLALGAARDARVPALPAAWDEPVREWFAELEQYFRDPTVSDADLLNTLEAAIVDLPDAIKHMDVDALARVFEAGMGQAALAGALGSQGGKFTTRLPSRCFGSGQAKNARLPSRCFGSGQAKKEAALAAADDLEQVISEYGIVPAPLAEAVAKLGRKTPVGAKLSSEQWSRVPVALRERAQFSAHVESLRFLGTVHDKVGKRLAMEREQLTNGKSAFVDRDSFIRDMRAIAAEEGIETTDAAGKGTVRDIHSVKRLGMIYDMQTQSAQAFARRKMDLDPDVLDQFPAYRLTESIATVPRNIEFWRARWNQAGSETGWIGAARAPFVALKTSPIWTALNAPFGVPWPPFDWGSTRDLEDVDREAAIGYGLLDGAEVVPGEDASDPDFIDGMQASAEGIDDDGRAWLEEQFGDQVDMTADAVRWKPASRKA